MRTYEGTAYRQSKDPKAPWIISFVARAEDITAFAGIPRRATVDMGFQRTADPKRVENAKLFFDLKTNQSPTAIVLGIHPSDETDERVRLELLEDVDAADTSAAGTLPTTALRRCRLHINEQPDASVASLVELLSRQIDARLKADVEAGEDEGDEVESEDVEGDDDTDADSENEDEEAEHEVVELGRSLLRTLLARLQDEDWVRTNEEVVRDLAKPATVIDGQHRLLGADACERGIPFTVCAIYDCSWAEQIFQFTIINYTQTGIPDQFITANAALSLTKGELGKLKGRLQHSGVKVLEYDLMQVVQFDTRSPFYEKVNLSEKKDPTRIGYKTMVRVAREWYTAASSHNGLKTLIGNLYPDVTGKGKRSRQLDLWREKDWGDFFLDFWSIVHETYASKPSHDGMSSLWETGKSQLLVAIVLFELQAQFFKDLNGQDEEYFEVTADTYEQRKEALREKLRKRARKFVEWYPPDFFGTKWAMKSLSTGPGRVALEQVLTKLREQKGKYQFTKSALITGQTTSAS